MSLIPESVLSKIREVHDSALFDTCVREIWSDTDEGYGYGDSYTDSSPLSCMFVEESGEIHGRESSDEIIHFGARILLARGTTISHKDRIRVTHFHGDPASMIITYDIVDGPIEHHTGIICYLEAVTGLE